MLIRWSALMVLSAMAWPAMGAQTSFEYCTVCHGANGNGNPAIHAPRIAGLEPWYLKSQFAAFKAGWRGVPEDAPGSEMRPVAQVLTSAEIDQAIAYVGSFSPKAPPPVTISGDVEHGKTVYQLCASCHGAAGQGNQSLHAPALAMRTDWYLATQLRNYRSGLRGADKADSNGQEMRAVAASLPNDEAVDDVVAYIDSLRSQHK